MLLFCIKFLGRRFPRRLLADIDSTFKRTLSVEVTMVNAGGGVVRDLYLEK